MPTLSNQPKTEQAANARDIRLAVSGLKAGYGERVILESVDMTVAAGEIRIVLGGSGCGKSTLLKNAIGIERPMAGTIEVLGEAIDWSQGRPGLGMFSKVGVLFQGGALLSSLTVAENVAMPLRLHHPELPDTVIDDLVTMKLEQVRMAHAHHRSPNELSGGMRKRAALARALVLDPSLLFCDEPSAGLDPVTSRGLDDLLLELREALGLALVVVTHELDSIRTLCDRLTFLAGGHVIFDGSLDEAEASGPREVQDFLSRKPLSEAAAGPRLAIRREDN
jgi:phospholipid/cholesterol/gamma-HCH transport system ATP-binding protein